MACIQFDGVELATYCATDLGPCKGLCPNADVSGLGVRIGFYLQSVMNALLVVLSPEDSSQGAWAATILTGPSVCLQDIQSFIRASPDSAIQLLLSYLQSFRSTAGH